MARFQLKFVVLNLTALATVYLVACADNKGQVSKQQTAPPTSTSDNDQVLLADDKVKYKQILDNYLKQINQSKGTPQEEKSWEKSNKALQQAIKDNFGGDINDTEPLVEATPPKPVELPTTETPKVEVVQSPTPESKSGDTITEMGPPAPSTDFNTQIQKHIEHEVELNHSLIVLPTQTLPTVKVPDTTPVAAPAVTIPAKPSVPATSAAPPKIEAPLELPAENVDNMAEKTSDLSPIKLLKNLLCKTPQHCLPSLEDPRDQAVGFYYFRKDLGFGGKLINGRELPQQGAGYYVKTNSQTKRWATDHAIVYVQKLAESVEKLKLTQSLIVGNISQFGGGYVASQKIGGDTGPGHQSHQNGLDIDIGLIQKSSGPFVKETFPKNFVVNNVLTENFPLTENWQFIHMAMSSNWNLFVLAHPAIKKKFCEIAKASGEFEKYKKTLSLILPESCHYDHYHFRLKCPSTSPRCIPHEPLPENPGCDNIKFQPCQIATNSQ